jgi:hypothetical protein
MISDRINLLCTYFANNLLVKERIVCKWRREDVVKYPPQQKHQITLINKIESYYGGGGI